MRNKKWEIRIKIKVNFYVAFELNWICLCDKYKFLLTWQHTSPIKYIWQCWQIYFEIYIFGQTYIFKKSRNILDKYKFWLLLIFDLTAPQGEPVLLFFSGSFLALQENTKYFDKNTQLTGLSTSELCGEQDIVNCVNSAFELIWWFWWFWWNW